MTREIDTYDHLNNPADPDSGIVQKMSLDELAQKLLEMNYGLWRFISELNRAVNDPKNRNLKDRNGQAVEAIVEAFKRLPRY